MVRSQATRMVGRQATPPPFNRAFGTSGGPDVRRLERPSIRKFDNLSAWPSKALAIESPGNRNVWRSEWLSRVIAKRQEAQQARGRATQIFSNPDVQPSEDLAIEVAGNSECWTARSRDIQTARGPNGWTTCGLTILKSSIPDVGGSCDLDPQPCRWPDLLTAWGLTIQIPRFPAVEMPRHQSVQRPSHSDIRTFRGPKG
jgi:hypothetical protein